MKIAVLGGGGVRSMFLAKSLAQKADALGIDKIVFMDNNEKKLEIYGGLAKETARRINAEVLFELTLDAKEAVTDADYVITTIRSGEDDMRVKDERIALSHHVLGQETTGAAGFSFAMRSIPVLADYCELVRRYAKKTAKVFNFTNPAGVVSQTLRDMGYDFTYGICDAPSGMLRSFAKIYGADPEDITGECFGLNHLSYFSSIKIKGEEVLPELLDNDRIYQESDMRFFQKEFARETKHALNEYLYYFYYREQAVENILKADQTRGESIAKINKAMTEELSHMNPQVQYQECLKVFEKWYGLRENNYMAAETGAGKKTKPYKFDIQEQDDGGYAGVALKYIKVEQTNETSQMILCVPNGGAIKGLADTDVVEVTCDISKEGCVPHIFSSPDPRCMEWIHRVKTYERLASSALRSHSIKDAVDCLMFHPLVNSYSLAKELVTEYLVSNHDFIKEEGWC